MRAGETGAYAGIVRIRTHTAAVRVWSWVRGVEWASWRSSCCSLNSKTDLLRLAAGARANGSEDGGVRVWRCPMKGSIPMHWEVSAPRGEQKKEARLGKMTNGEGEKGER
jgi:hypothetical protein